MSATTSGNGTSDLEAQLTELHRESEARTAELREIAAQLPAVVGRRAMLRSLIGDTAANPNKGELLRRGLLKLGRIPNQLRHDIAHRLGRRPG